MMRVVKATLTAFSVFAYVPVLSAADLPVQVPKSLVFPNYDNVLLGKDQALEGGAYIARTADASANFYNPAGLVQSEKSSINVSATGWQRTKITAETLGESVTSNKIDNVPGYFGIVIGPPFIDSRNLRFGVSLTRLVAWSPGSIDQSLAPSSVNGLDRVTYSSASDFTTQLYQAAIAWAPVSDRSLRLGFSLGLANTAFNGNSTLSGLVTVAGQPGQFLSSLRGGGNEWDGVIGAGVQWDVTPRWTIGAAVRSPGLRITAGSLVTYESSILTSPGPTSAFFRDDTGRFEYKEPFAASLGVAARFGDAQLEADVRYHAGTGTYDLYRSSAQLQVLTHNPGGSTSSSAQPMSPITYAGKRVWNGSVGGDVRVARIATLHAGFYTAFSPIDEAQASPFRKADLFGASGGVDFQLEHFGIAVGVGYEFGSSPTTGVSLGNGQQIQASSMNLQLISLLYAVSYSF